MSKIVCQKIIVIFLGAVVVISMHYLYPLVRPGWVIYREAEDSYQAKEWQQAAFLYEESLQMGVRNPVIKLQLARSYFEMKNFSKAKAAYREYLSEHPNDVWVLKEYAGALTASGEFEEAAKVYQELLKTEEHDNR